MKPFAKLLAAFGICAALLVPFAAAGGEVGTSVEFLVAHSWFDAPCSDHTGLLDSPGFESSPLRAETELDEDLDSDSAAPSAHGDRPALAAKTPIREASTSSCELSLGARSPRGPPIV